MFGANHKGETRAHTLKHTDEKPYKCHLCEASFSSSQTFKRHIKKNQMRGYCPKRKKKVELNRGEPYKCHLCNVTFSKPGTLKMHIRKIQAKGDCPTTRNGHIQIEYIEGEPYKCHLCKVTFSMLSTLKKHTRKIQVKGDCPSTRKRKMKVEHIKSDPKHEEDTWKIDRAIVTQSFLRKTTYESWKKNEKRVCVMHLFM